MGTKTTVQTQSTEKNTPPAWAQPGLEAIGNRISQILPNVPGEAYTGDFLAQPTALDRGVVRGYQNNADFARSMSIPALAAMNMGLTQMPTFEGPGLGAGTGSFANYDPTAVQGTIASAIKPVTRNLMENILPQIRSAGIESGAYGSEKSMTTLPGLAIRDANESMNDIATRIAYQDFSDQQQRTLSAYGLGTQRGLGAADTLTGRLNQFPSLLDSVMRMQTGATDIDAQAAAYDKALTQSEIDNQINKTEYNIRQPFQGLDVAAALLGQVANPWGIRSTSGTQTQTSGGLGAVVQGVAGLGLAGASLFGAGGPLSSLFKTTAGAGASDRRLKRDIIKLHEEPDGLGVYGFKYNWSDDTQLGVMADEVAEIRPWALGPEVAGFQTVNYGAL